MTLPPRTRERAVNLPPAILVAVLVLAGIHLVREVLPDRDDFVLLLRGAFFPAPWSVVLGRVTPEAVLEDAIARPGGDESGASAHLAAFLVQTGPEPWSPLSYALLHGSWTHLGLNLVWLVAFGTPVVRRVGAMRALLLAALATLGGSGAQWLVHPAGTQPLIGASAAISGLMGAAAFFVFERGPASPASLAGLLGNRAALVFLLMWFVVNLLFAAVAGPLALVEGTIAWEAHIGGLLLGLAVFPALDRSADRSYLRQT